MRLIVWLRGPRIRVITRAEPRRIWFVEQKREIVAESLSGDMSVSATARKHDVSPGLLFTWRRQLLAGDLNVPVTRSASFARVEMLAAPPDSHVRAGQNSGE